jgi:aspartate racemase
MKCVGLIGGIGWESTARYYRLINDEVRNRYGSLHSARLVVNSLEFQVIDSLVKSNRWNDAGLALADAARVLERAGAEALVLCSNLMHYVAEPTAAAVKIPLLHIGDAVLAEARAARANRLGLIGTRFTLEHDFLLERPAARAGARRLPVEILMPAAAEFGEIDRIIYDELCRGVVRDTSRATLLRLAKDLRPAALRQLCWAPRSSLCCCGPMISRCRCWTARRSMRWRPSAGRCRMRPSRRRQRPGVRVRPVDSRRVGSPFAIAPAGSAD